MNELLKQDLRSGWLEVGDKWQPLDFIGVALGAYFIYDGVTRKAPPWLTISLGAVMVYIHSQRFFYAPQSRDGLIRLAKTLNLSQKDFDAIALELKK